MKSTFIDRVYYSDTDAYGVVWHGSYLRWLEKGRILFCDECNISLIELEKQNIIIPVASLNMRYKVPAKLNDDILVSTELIKLSKTSAVFEQIITDLDRKIVYLKAEITVVAVDKNGKLYMKMPDFLYNIFNEVKLCND